MGENPVGHTHITFSDSGLDVEDCNVVVHAFTDSSFPVAHGNVDSPVVHVGDSTFSVSGCDIGDSSGVDSSGAHPDFDSPVVHVVDNTFSVSGLDVGDSSEVHAHSYQNCSSFSDAHLYVDSQDDIVMSSVITKIKLITNTFHLKRMPTTITMLHIRAFLRKFPMSEEAGEILVDSPIE